MSIGKDRESSIGGNVVWFLTGALIGAAITVLYAPKSGKDTRQYLADRTEEFRGKAAGLMGTRDELEYAPSDAACDLSGDPDIVSR